MVYSCVSAGLSTASGHAIKKHKSIALFQLYAAFRQSHTFQTLLRIGPMTKKRKKNNHPRMLRYDDRPDPLLVPKAGEESGGGFSRINVTALNAFIDEHPEDFEVKDILLLIRDDENLEEKHIEQADISRPLILAEIAPDRFGIYPGIEEEDWRLRGYSLIDGNHRAAKAKRLGIEKLPAYIVRMEQHLPFMYSHFESYVDYWNNKLADYEKDNENG